MILTPEQIKEVAELASPIVSWLNRNCNPHVAVVIEASRVEVTEGLAALLFEYKEQEPETEMIT